MRQVPLERDTNIAVNGCSGFATSTQKAPFTAMLISRSRGTYLIEAHFLQLHCLISRTCEFVSLRRRLHKRELDPTRAHSSFSCSLDKQKCLKIRLASGVSLRKQQMN